MKLVIETINRGLGASNCYICSSGDNALVIDPGCDLKYITDNLNRNDLKLRYIFLTHGHYDHISALDELRELYPDAITYAHKNTSEDITDPIRNGSFLFGTMKTYNKTDRTYSEGDVLQMDGIEFKILETPGHSSGCVCIIAENNIFTGDVLFRENIGRSDLPGGDPKALMRSLERIMSFDDDTNIYPGHGRMTTIKHERSANPHIRGRSW